jgi:hypothetical protein
MISFSRLKALILGSNYNQYAFYSPQDKDFNETNDLGKDWQAEYEVSTSKWHGFIDYINFKNKTFTENKIRSARTLDKWFILQALIYQDALKELFPNNDTFEFKILIYNRKKDMELVEYTEKDIQENYKEKYEWAVKILNYVLANFKEVDKLCEQLKSDTNQSMCSVNV